MQKWENGKKWRDCRPQKKNNLVFIIRKFILEKTVTSSHILQLNWSRCRYFYFYVAHFTTVNMHSCLIILWYDICMFPYQVSPHTISTDWPILIHNHKNQVYNTFHNSQEIVCQYAIFIILFAYNNDRHTHIEKGRYGDIYILYTIFIH